MHDLFSTPLLAIILAAALSCVVTALAIRWSRHLHLVVAPNHRSSHAMPTPGSGGIGIVTGGTVAGLIFSSGLGSVAWPLIILAGLLALVGLRDDIRYLSIKTRLLVQFGCIAILVVLLPPAITIPLAQGIDIPAPIILAAAMIAGMWWLNLFNFMDGIDGLAGSHAIFMLGMAAFLGAYGHPQIMQWASWGWMVALAAAVTGFLAFNWATARIFMGDVGSLYLAFMIFALMLLSLQQGWLELSTWLILVAPFVCDTTVTLCTRMRRHERWHEAHSSHAYQRLARYYGSHAKATLLYVAVDIGWVAPLAALAHFGQANPVMLIMLSYAPLAVCAMRLGAGHVGNIS